MTPTAQKLATEIRISARVHALKRFARDTARARAEGRNLLKEAKGLGRDLRAGK